MARQRGVFILVVGPSGVGKDTLIGRARDALADDPRFVFPRRLITRPPEPEGENHVAISEAEFRRGVAEGIYCLHWQAHGLGYALPRDLNDALALGFHVVANVSRTVIDDARHRYAPVRVLLLEAGVQLRAERLATRDRESAAEQQARLERRDIDVAMSDDVVRFVNDGPLSEVADRFVAALRRMPPD